MRALIIFLLLLVFNLSVAVAQEKTDSAKTSGTKKVFLKGMKLVSSNPLDTIVNVASIDNFTQYEGKIIRHINIDRVGFEMSIYDSTKKVATTVTKVANALHSDTREGTIRQHLFFRQHQPVNPYKLADNER